MKNKKTSQKPDSFGLLLFYDMTRHEWEIKLKQEYLSHESISKTAYSYWQEDGCPDGEKIDERTGWKIKEIQRCEIQIGACTIDGD